MVDDVLFTRDKNTSGRKKRCRVVVVWEKKSDKKHKEQGMTGKQPGNERKKKEHAQRNGTESLSPPSDERGRRAPLPPERMRSARGAVVWFSFFFPGGSLFVYERRPCRERSLNFGRQKPTTNQCPFLISLYFP